MEEDGSSATTAGLHCTVQPPLCRSTPLLLCLPHWHTPMPDEASGDVERSQNALLAKFSQSSTCALHHLVSPPPPAFLRFNQVWHGEYRCTYAGLWSALPLVCICLFFHSVTPPPFQFAFPSRLHPPSMALWGLGEKELCVPTLRPASNLATSTVTQLHPPTLLTQGRPTTSRNPSSNPCRCATVCPCHPHGPHVLTNLSGNTPMGTFADRCEARQCSQSFRLR